MRAIIAAVFVVFALSLTALTQGTKAPDKPALDKQSTDQPGTHSPGGIPQAKPSDPDPTVPIIIAVIGVVAGLGGVGLGAWLTRRNDIRKQRLEFAGLQLREFYSPLLAERTHIRSIGELRVRVQNEAQEAWADIMADARGGDPSAFASVRDQRRAGFEGLIDNDNKRFRAETMPRYVEMLIVSDRLALLRWAI